MRNIWNWIKYLWNLRTVLDEYTSKLDGLLEMIDRMLRQIEDLRQAKIDLEKEVKKLKKECEGIPIEIVEEENPEKDKSRITKVNRYYDPQLGVEYFDFEINGEKASPDDDTVVE